MTRYPGLVLCLTWCVAVATAVVIAPMQPVFGVFAIALALPCLAAAAVLRPALLAVALGVALLALARVELPIADASTITRAHELAGHSVTLIGRIADDARPAGGGAEALVEPTAVVSGESSIQRIGNVMVRWRGPAQVALGDVIQSSGRAVLPRDVPAFDRRAYLAQRDVYLQLNATSFDVITPASGISSIPAWIRAREIAAVQAALPAPHAAMLLGIVLGIKQGLPARLQQALIATGLIHLLVLSGLKVAVFSRIVQGGLRPVLGRAAAWPALALIALYAMTGGATPAAVRAAAMGGMAITAANLGRPSHVWTSLAVTGAAMLGWRPELAWDVGFQLSFAGTVAIILLAPPIAARVAFLPHFVREPFAVTCAAQLGTLPMMAADFHVLSPVGPVANALTLPLLPIVVTAGLLLSGLSFAPELARIAAIPLAGVLAYIEQVALLLSRVPAAAITVPSFPAWMGAAYYSALGSAVAASHSSGGRRKFAYAVAAIAPALVSITALVAWSSSPPQVSVFDVGDGQAVLLRGPRGAILIDGGPSPSKLANELGLQLPPWQRNLDALVVTAPGLGHVGGFAGFDRAASMVVFPDAQLTGKAWRAAALEQVAHGASTKKLRAGDFVRVAGFDLQAIAPERGAPGEIAGAADLALRAVGPDGRSFCDLSDLDLDGQSLAAQRIHGRCTYVLLPNGGKSTLSPNLERAAVDGATQLIASRSSGGRIAAGFPPAVLRTDQEGTITLPL